LVTDLQDHQESLFTGISDTACVKILIKKGLGALLSSKTLVITGAPRVIRTLDLRIRSPSLYPTELWAQVAKTKSKVYQPLVGTKFPA
jgi:hypothetical protein